jgi:SAM-dependent methyltransferase
MSAVTAPTSAAAPPRPLVGLAAAIVRADPGVPVHDLYDDAGAELYDRMVHASAELAPVLHELHDLHERRGPVPAAPVLDLACGSGRVGLQLARRGHAVVGVDLSEAMLARYRGRLAREPGDVVGRTTLHRCDIHGLGDRFAPGSFRAAVLGATTIVLVEPARRPALFATIAGLLAPGGVFLLDVPDLDPRELRERPERTTVFELTGGAGPAWVLALQSFDVAARREVVNFVVDGTHEARRVVTTTKRIVFASEVMADLTGAGLAVRELGSDGSGHWLAAGRPPGSGPAPEKAT